MRARTIGCGLLMAGLALVPVGCGSDAAGSSSGSSTEAVAHAEHAGIAPGAAAKTASAAPSRLDIVATEYEWSGLPDKLPAGSYPVSFRNAGTQMHEISIFRNPDHLSLPKLFELGPVGIKDAVEMAGTLISGPGAAADQDLTVTLTPGEYDVVCFIPATSDGKPHFSHGMHRTLEVR